MMDSRPMIKITLSIFFATLLVVGGARGASAEIRIGVGVLGPISPQTETDIDQLVGKYRT